VTLVSPELVLEIRPRLYEAKPETLAVALLPFLRKIDVSFVRGAAIRLDTAAKVVTLAAGDRLAYDRLVVATGSRMRRPPVPGAEAAFSVDTQAEAIAFDRRLGEIAGGVGEPTIAVVGAGFTGIELALELRDRAAGARRRWCAPATAHRTDRPGRDGGTGARTWAAASDRGGAGGRWCRVAPRRRGANLGGGPCELR
jgi:NADH dehydrogenase FAD-containing subunit